MAVGSGELVVGDNLGGAVVALEEQEVAVEKTGRRDSWALWTGGGAVVVHDVEEACGSGWWCYAMLQ